MLSQVSLQEHVPTIAMFAIVSCNGFRSAIVKVGPPVLGKFLLIFVSILLSTNLCNADKKRWAPLDLKCEPNPSAQSGIVNECFSKKC